MSGDAGKTVRVLVEHRNDSIVQATMEVLGFAAGVGEALRAPVSAVVIGHPVRPLAETVAALGWDVVGIETERASVYTAEAYRALLANLEDRQAEDLFLLPHTALGWDLGPALAVDLGASCIAAVTEFVDGEGPVFRRQVCNGKLVQDLRLPPGRPAVLTVMPGAVPSREPPGHRPGEVRIGRSACPDPRTRRLRSIDPPPSAVGLREAEVVVAAGRGMAEEEQIERVRELAACFPRSAVGASRPLCDEGVLPFACQVGMTGQTVAPKLYVACGISGAVQHTVGVQGGGLTVAVNTDRNAPFLRTADVGVVADAGAFLPLLVERIRRERE